MPNNPLFPRHNKAMKQARQTWNRSTAGKMMKEVQSAARTVRSGGTLGHEFREGMRMMQFGRMGVLSQLFTRSSFGDFAGEMMRYSKRGGMAARLISPFLKQLGPVGTLLSAMMKTGKSGTGLQAELNAAQTFLEAFGGKVQMPSAGRMRGGPSGGSVQTAIDDARRLLESQGYRVSEPSKPVPGGRREEEPIVSITKEEPEKKPEKLYPGGVSRTTKRGTERQIVELEIDGRKRRFPVAHPIVTGAMTRTPESSNVYAFSYAYDDQTLYVRFQQPAKYSGGATGAPGPLYAYFHVPVRVYLSFLDVGSKGGFVWDSLRRRGTVSGHQYDYRLFAIRGGYVPRKASVRKVGGSLQEWYEMRKVKVRNVRTGNIRELTSGAPMRALPYRGN